MNLMNYFDFSANNIIGMCVSLFMLIAICIWAQSFRKKTRNIIGNRNKFFIFSIILIVVSVLSLLKYGVNYGLDFTGGTIVEVGFQNNVTAEQIREALIKINPSYSEAVIQLEKKDSSEPGPTKCLIRVREVISAKGVASDKPNEESIEKKKTEVVKTQIDIYNTDTIKNEIYNNETLKKAERITDQSKPIDSKLTLFTNKLNELNGGKAVEIYKVESIGPVIGKELTRKAIIALVIALLFQLVYITVRFGSQMRYGLAADIALAHDLIIMVGIYSIMSIFNKSVQVDSPFVAALLTVVGYSVMDSIVIFDRIRENLKVHSKESFEEVVNISVNQTMTRSINTLMTVLFPMFALYFFGGATLKSFAFALLVGLTSGAYSSIFIASPMLVMLDNFIKAKDKRQRDARSRELSELEEQRKKAKEEAKTKKM